MYKRQPAADVLPYATDDERDAWLLRFCAEAEDVDVDAVAARVEASVAWRLGEGKPIVEAARDAGIKVIPCYSGEDHGAKQVDKWVKAYRDHAVFKYVFRENARDVLNKQNPESVKKTLAYLASLVV